ncbi:6792_t:CDS:2, partial [Dentiscutata erythropus]
FMSNWIPWRRTSPTNSDTSDNDEQTELTEQPPPTSPGQHAQLIRERRQQLSQQIQQEQGTPSNSQPVPENIEFIIHLDKDDEQTLQQAIALSL